MRVRGAAQAFRTGFLEATPPWDGLGGAVAPTGSRFSERRRVCKAAAPRAFVGTVGAADSDRRWVRAAVLGPPPGANDVERRGGAAALEVPALLQGARES